MLLSVDHVPSCRTNGLTHAPTVLSLAPAAAPVFCSSRRRRWARCIHCLCAAHSSWVVVRFSNCALLRHDWLPLYFDLSNSVRGDQSALTRDPQSKLNRLSRGLLGAAQNRMWVNRDVISVASVTISMTLP